MEDTPEKYDCVIKIIMIGDSCVGKTSLVSRFVDGRFSQAQCATTGVPATTTSTVVDGLCTELKIWDTGGVENFSTSIIGYYQRSQGVMLVYDCTRMKTFLDARKWIKLMGLSSIESRILVANKCDMRNKEVTTEDGMALAEGIGAAYLETSAKQDINVTSAFTLLTRDVKYRLIDKVACKQDHLLHHFVANIDGFRCNCCRTLKYTNDELYGCRQCDYDLCFVCFNKKTTLNKIALSKIDLYRCIEAAACPTVLIDIILSFTGMITSEQIKIIRRQLETDSKKHLFRKLKKFKLFSRK